MSQSYVFVRAVPTDIDKLSAQILSAGPRYQYLNLTVHSCHTVGTVLGYFECLNQHHAPLWVAWSQVSDEWWDSQVCLFIPFLAAVKGHPSSWNPSGAECGFLWDCSTVYISFAPLCPDVLMPLHFSPGNWEQCPPFNKQLNPAYIAPS